MMMMRYWQSHGRPARLAALRTSPDAVSIEIEMAGHDTIQVNGKAIPLDRYNVGT